MTKDELIALLSKFDEQQLEKALACAQQQIWIKQMWEEHLREFYIHWAADLAKIVLVIVGLAVFYGLILIGRQIHYPEKYLSILEQTHFWISFTSSALLGLMFIGKGVLALGMKKK